MELNDRHYILIWLGLLALTGLTITAASIDLGFFNTVVALAIATAKSSLIAWYFMHLRTESRALRIMVLAALLILAIFIGFTFFDVGPRYR